MDCQLFARPMLATCNYYSMTQCGVHIVHMCGPRAQVPPLCIAVPLRLPWLCYRCCVANAARLFYFRAFLELYLYHNIQRKTPNCVFTNELRLSCRVLCRLQPDARTVLWFHVMCILSRVHALFLFSFPFSFFFFLCFVPQVRVAGRICAVRTLRQAVNSAQAAVKAELAHGLGIGGR